jgi:hypothetical protein
LISSRQAASNSANSIDGGLAADFVLADLNFFLDLAAIGILPFLVCRSKP